MSAHIIKDREVIVASVLEGILSPEHITEEELFDLEETVFELVCDKYTPFATWETIQ